MYTNGLPPGAAPPPTGTIALSSTADALFFASRPASPTRPSSGPGSRWDDSDDDFRRPPDSPDSKYSSQANSRRVSRQSEGLYSLPQSQSQTPSRSKFSDEDTSGNNSDEERYGRPDGQATRRKSEGGNESDTSSHATAPGSADLFDSLGFLDDRPERYYRASAREAEAYRHLAAVARKPSPRPEELALPQVAARSPDSGGYQLANPLPATAPSPIPSPTLPLNIKKKPGASPASPNFSAAHFSGSFSDNGGPGGSSFSRFDTPSTVSRFDTSSGTSSGGDRLSDADGTRSSVASNGGSGAVHRASTVSQPTSSSSRASRVASMSRQLSSDRLSQFQSPPPPPPPPLPELDPRKSQPPMPDLGPPTSQQPPEEADDMSSDDQRAKDSDDEDDVPLARRIPGALKAQQSIRAKDKEDRMKRRAERAARKAEVAAAANARMPKLPTQNGFVNVVQQATAASASSSSAFPSANGNRGRPNHQQSPPPPAPASFVDDLSRRLAQVQSGDHRSSEHQTGLAEPQPQKRTSRTYADVQPEQQVRKQPSHTLFGRPHTRQASSESLGPAREFRSPSPSNDADPDAKMRAYAAANAQSVSNRASLAKRQSGAAPASRSRPPSPPRMPPPPRQTVVSPRLPHASISRPASPPRDPHSQAPRRSATTATKRPPTADRAQAVSGVAVSRPGSPVMRPPSPSMNTMTPDERLRQAAMARGSRSRAISVSTNSRPALPNFSDPPPVPTPTRTPAPTLPVPIMDSQDAASRRPSVASPYPDRDRESPVTPRLQHIQPSSRTPEPQSVTSGMMSPPPMDSNLTPDERLRQIAMSRGQSEPRSQQQQSMAPPPAMTMDSTLTPDERLRQIALSRAQQATAAPSPTSSGFRKRAMSLGRPTKDDAHKDASSGAQPSRSRTLVRGNRGGAAPPVPAPPPIPTLSAHQKPCIVYMASGGQKAVGVEVRTGGKAKEVLGQLQAHITPGAQGWMLYEVCNDLNLERPIREFEIPSENVARWASDGNTFAVKQTRLANFLAQSSIPSVSPTHSSYVEFEVKKGKWNKRWLELRENNLWVSKRDNGKDAAFLCSLSNFDVYSAVRPTQKAPRFAFTLRSTDDLSMFENPADSLHCFCALDARDGERWIERIMVARSCVLAQERTALFRPSPQQQQQQQHGSATATATQPQSSLRRQPTVSRPLVDARSLAQAPTLSSPMTPSMRMGGGGGPFEPGSLLARATAAERA